jgi:hypothetical protein
MNSHNIDECLITSAIGEEAQKPEKIFSSLCRTSFANGLSKQVKNICKINRSTRCVFKKGLRLLAFRSLSYTIKSTQKNVNPSAKNLSCHEYLVY